MSTNSIVGIRTEEHPFRGRYVHWDGYPDGVGQAVAEIVRRDGFETAVKTITIDHPAWSQLSVDESISTWRDDTTVPGYGIAYDQDPDAWYTAEDNCGAEWAYAITPDVIEVWQKPLTTGVWTRRQELDISTHGGWYLQADNVARRFGPYADEQAAITARTDNALPAQEWKLVHHGR